ncbi:MAG: LamG-like jellyroll fold domain-containing protein [Pseudomonadales bacterium]
MANVNTLITGVVTTIKTQFPQLLACEALAGFLETTNVADIHSNTPAVYVASVGTGELTWVPSGENDLTVHMVAYVLLVNAIDSLQREQDNQILVTDLLDYVGRQQRWGLTNVHPATAVESEDVHGLTQDFQPHVKDWRLGVSVLARAADLYGGDEPVSNLALWAITWEQMIRIGEDLYDNAGETLPTDVRVRSDPDAAYVLITHVAAGMEFMDTDSDTGEVSGTVMILKADDETYISHYALYWGSDPTTPLEAAPIISLLAANGNDLTYDFPNNTPIPEGASSLLVMTQYNGLQREESISLRLQDKTEASDMASSLAFSDLDPQAGLVQGDVLIGKAANENTVSDYALYWGASASQPLVGEPLITLLAATGADLLHTFDVNTRLPYGATHLLVYTQYQGDEMGTGLSTTLTDLLADDLALWLDANDPYHRLETGGFVSQWGDKSHNAHHAEQADIASQPLTSIDTQNGRNLISFDGVDYLNVDSLAFIAANAYSICCVLKTNNMDNDVSILSFNTTEGVKSGHYIVRKSGEIDVELGRRRGTYTLAEAGTWVDNSVALLSIVTDGASMSLYMNGILHNTVTLTLQAADQCSLGMRRKNNGDPEKFFDGSMGELFIYARALADAERQTLEVRLLDQWGIVV